MLTRRTSIILTLAAGLSLTPSAAAEIRTLRFDLPQNPGIFGVVWQQDYFEPAFAGTIAEARLVVTFDTGGGVRAFHDAADILFQHQLATSTLPFWNVRGSDLGWSGMGRFTADITTHAFDGQPLINDGDFVLWFGRLVSDDDTQQLLGGSLIDSYWEFRVNVVPVPGTAAVLLAPLIIAGSRRARRRS